VRVATSPHSSFVAALFLAGPLVSLIPLRAVRAQASTSSSISLPTSLRLASPGWWPTKGEAARAEYLGSEACVNCHELKSEGQQQTAMFHAAAPSSDSKLLRDHPSLTFRAGPYSYQLTTTPAKVVLAVRDASSLQSVDLLWALGSAHMGQTFLFERDGQFYEGHLSFFTKSQSLDVTPGQSPAVPANLLEAVGRAMPLEETRQCFACHTLASTTKGQFSPAGSIPGVNCESCHGPGARHVAAASAHAEKRGSGLIFNPASLSRIDSVDFCGACHRTWQDVVSATVNSPPLVNVRFAPYRLENSQCWIKGDARITCIACHDPHKPLVHDPASYDANCLACHLSSAAEKRTPVRPGVACPVSTKNCVTCHMPKVEPPTLHSAFTDHWIRIAKPGSPYPE
jgi:hypothetical protein